MIIVAIFSIVESSVVLAILGRSCFSDDYIRDIRRRHYHIAVRFLHSCRSWLNERKGRMFLL